MTTLYVSGPMSGIPEFNYPAFEEATQQLRAAGYTVVSPHELDGDAGVDLGQPFTHEDRIAAMKRDAIAVLDADGIAVLPGWANSTGALAELALGWAVGVQARPVGEWLERAAVAA